MQEVRIDMSVLLSCLKEFLLIDRYLTCKIIQLYYSLISSLKQIITYNFDIPICLWLISKKKHPLQGNSYYVILYVIVFQSYLIDTPKYTEYISTYHLNFSSFFFQVGWEVFKDKNLEHLPSLFCHRSIFQLPTNCWHLFSLFGFW